MKTNKTLLMLAAAGLIGAGAGLALPGRASAQTVQHHCDANGCWNVACTDDGACRRVWDEDRAYHRHYSTTTSYDRDRANGRYIGNNWVSYGHGHRSWTCDAYGDNCHWIYESF